MLVPQHSLHFTQFVEGIVRLVLMRYEPVVPKTVLAAWTKSAEYQFEVGERGEEFGEGDDYSVAGDDVSAFGGGGRRGSVDQRGRRGSVSGNNRQPSVTSAMGDGARRGSVTSSTGDGQKSRQAYCRRGSSNLMEESGRRSSYVASQGGATFVSAAGAGGEHLFGSRGDDGGMLQLASTAVRLKFAFETHLWPTGGRSAVAEGGAKKSVDTGIDERHQAKLEKIFLHFCIEHEQEKKMEISEMVYALLSLNIVDGRLSADSAANLCLSTVSYLGCRRHDLLSLDDFFDVVLNIAEYKTYDGLCDKKHRIEIFLANELYVKVAKYTSLTSL